MRPVVMENLSKEKPEVASQDRCPQCHVKVPPRSRFCNMCGTPLAPKNPQLTPGNPPAAPVAVKPSIHATGAQARDNRARPNDELARNLIAAPVVSSEGEICLRRWVEYVQTHDEIPAFSHHVMQILGMMGTDEASLQALTNVVLRDYSMTLAVLRLANSAYYNRSGKTVCSVTRAVTLMGIDAVKRLAAGLLLLENYNKRPLGLRELLLLSLLTANHCFQLAQQLNISDAEQAYMCGMFRNLGEVLVALYFGETYELILREMKDHNLIAHDACLKVMDFTYESLGRAIASRWKLPAAVSRTMEPSNPAAFEDQSAEDKLKSVVALSHDLTYTIYRCASEDRLDAIVNLLNKYAAIPNLDLQTVEKVLAEAVTRTKETFITVGVPLNELHLRRQYELALSGSTEFQEACSAALSALMDIQPAASMAADPHPGVNEDLLAQLVAEVQAAIEPGNQPRFNEVLMMVLEALHRGAGFERVVFCLATRDRTAVRGRIGLGRAIDSVINLLNIPLFGTREPLTLPLLSKKDLFVNTQADDRYRDSGLAETLGASCFGLYPIVVGKLVVGCLYFDKLTPDAPPSQKILDAVAQLRNLVADLLRHTRINS